MPKRLLPLGWAANSVGAPEKKLCGSFGRFHDFAGFPVARSHHVIASAVCAITCLESGVKAATPPNFAGSAGNPLSGSPVVVSRITTGPPVGFRLASDFTIATHRASGDAARNVTPSSRFARV